MLVFPRSGSSVAGRVRALVDGMIVALSALITSWVFVLGPVFRSGGTTLEHAIGLAYPIGDIVVITIVLYVLLLRERRHERLLLPAMIGIAFVAMACSDSAFTYMTAKGDYTTGSPADAGPPERARPAPARPAPCFPTSPSASRSSRAQWHRPASTRRRSSPGCEPG
jgi:hypothetical protein